MDTASFNREEDRLLRELKQTREKNIAVNLGASLLDHWRNYGNAQNLSLEKCTEAALTLIGKNLFPLAQSVLKNVVEPKIPESDFKNQFRVSYNVARAKNIIRKIEATLPDSYSGTEKDSIDNFIAKADEAARNMHSVDLRVTSMCKVAGCYRKINPTLFLAKATELVEKHHALPVVQETLQVAKSQTGRTQSPHIGGNEAAIQKIERLFAQASLEANPSVKFQLYSEAAKLADNSSSIKVLEHFERKNAEADYPIRPTEYAENKPKAGWTETVARARREAGFSCSNYR